MGLAKGFRLLNLILLVVAAVLMLVTPLYYNTQHIVLTVKSGDSYIEPQTLYNAYASEADKVDYELIGLGNEYVIIDSVEMVNDSETVDVVYQEVKETKTTVDGTEVSTETTVKTTTQETVTTKVYNVVASAYDENDSVFLTYQFQLNDKDYELIGGIQKGDKFYLGVKSVSSKYEIPSDSLVQKYAGRDELVRYQTVTGAAALFSGDNSGKTNAFLFLFVSVVSGAVTLLVSLFLMNKRTEVIAANVISALFALVSGIFGVLLFGSLSAKYSIKYVEVGGLAMALLTMLVLAVTLVVSLIGATSAMKSREKKLFGKVMTTVSAISLFVVFIMQLTAGSASVVPGYMFLIGLVGALAWSIVTIVVFAKNTKNDKLNENGVVEEDNTYVDPNAQQPTNEE